MLSVTSNDRHVPKSVFCTLVNSHCGRQHGRNCDHELVLRNVNETFFSRPRTKVSRPRPNLAGIEAPRRPRPRHEDCNPGRGQCFEFSSVLWHGWLDYRKDIRPMKAGAIYPRGFENWRRNQLTQADVENDCWNRGGSDGLNWLRSTCSNKWSK